MLVSLLFPHLLSNVSSNPTTEHKRKRKIELCGTYSVVSLAVTSFAKMRKRTLTLVCQKKRRVRIHRSLIFLFFLFYLIKVIITSMIAFLILIAF